VLGNKRGYLLIFRRSAPSISRHWHAWLGVSAFASDASERASSLAASEKSMHVAFQP